MIDLICKTDDCDSVVTCDEGVIAVTCSNCCARGRTIANR